MESRSRRAPATPAHPSLPSPPSRALGQQPALAEFLSTPPLRPGSRVGWGRGAVKERQNWGSRLNSAWISATEGTASHPHSSTSEYPAVFKAPTRLSSRKSLPAEAREITWLIMNVLARGHRVGTASLTEKPSDLCTGREVLGHDPGRKLQPCRCDLEKVLQISE